MSSQPTVMTADDLLDGRPTLVLSPHMDDAVLSASAIVTAVPCDVWTVFTGQPVPPQTTAWDLSCGFADSDATISARRLEDAAAFADTPARTRHLDAWEGAYADPERRRRELPAIRRAIEEWLNAHPEGTLVIPACAGLHVPPPVWDGLRRRVAARRGAPDAPFSATPSDASANGALPTEAEPQAEATPGTSTAPTPPETRGSGAAGLAGQLKAQVIGTARRAVQRALHEEHLRRRKRVIGDDGLAANPDHIELRDLALDLVTSRPGVRVVLMEDLPYLWHEAGDAEVARVEKARGFATTKVALDVDADAKFARLQRYASQVGVLDTAGRLVERGHIPAVEHYWVVNR